MLVSRFRSTVFIDCVIVFAPINHTELFVGIVDDANGAYWDRCEGRNRSNLSQGVNVSNSIGSSHIPDVGFATYAAVFDIHIPE